MEVDLIDFFIRHRFDPIVLTGVFFASLAVLLGRYLLLSGLIQNAIQKNPDRFQKYKVQKKWPSAEQVKNERSMGIQANIYLAMSCTMLHVLIFDGKTKLYYNAWNEKGVLYYLFSIAAVILIYDCYFYWIHYLLHKNKYLFKHVHSWHHRFKNPSIFSDLALHPIEALLYVAIIPVMLMTLPIHSSVLGFFYLFLIVGNISGHVGLEVFPSSTRNSLVGKCITFMCFHNFHHSHVQGNYGFITRFWDKRMGTEIGEYNDWLIDATPKAQEVNSQTEDRAS